MKSELRTHVSFLLLTTTVIVALWLLLDCQFFYTINIDKLVDRKHVIAAAIVYGALLNVARWVTALLRKPRAELVLALISIISTLLVLHVLSPLVFPTRAIPRYRSFFSTRYHHVLPPNETMFAGKVAGEKVFVTTNEDGLRSRYSRERYLKYATRIAILGDSFAFGMRIQTDGTWPHLLEKRLRQHFQRNDIAVLNAGILSYSPLLERRQYHGIIKHYRPHIVVLLVDVTDIGDDFRYASEIGSDGMFRGIETKVRVPKGLFAMLESFRKTLRAGIALPYELVKRIAGDDGENKAAGKRGYDYYHFSITVPANIETNRFFIYRYPLSITKEYFDFTYSHLVNIAQSCEDLEAKFAIVPVPRFHHWNVKECPNNWERQKYRLDEPYQYEFFRYFQDMVTDKNMDVVNLLELFQATSEYPLVFDNDPHWNKRGQEFVARAMEKYLVSHYEGAFTN